MIKEEKQRVDGKIEELATFSTQSVGEWTAKDNATQAFMTDKLAELRQSNRNHVDGLIATINASISTSESIADRKTKEPL